MPARKSAPKKEPDAKEAAAPSKAQSPTSASEANVVQREQLERAATEYYERLTEAATRLNEQARRLYGMSHNYAREHPAGLIAGALAVGVAVGILFDRD